MAIPLQLYSPEIDNKYVLRTLVLIQYPSKYELLETSLVGIQCLYCCNGYDRGTVFNILRANA